MLAIAVRGKVLTHAGGLILLVLVAVLLVATTTAQGGPRPRAVVLQTTARSITPQLSAASPRTITLVNRTGQTIWPAATPGSTAGVTGWTLAPGQSLSFTVPHDWNARLWGRTGCHFSAGGHGSCQTGDCNGLYQCTGWGSIPATLFETDFDSFDQLDFYDVSMVDGSNLPMYVNTVGSGTPDRISADGCEQGHGCTTTVKCPTALDVRRAGKLVGCISPCARFGTSRYCCSGQYAQGCNPATTWPVDYARVFKAAEPYAYSWSGDDASSTFTCSLGCDYRVIFGVTPPAVGGAPG